MGDDKQKIKFVPSMNIDVPIRTVKKKSVRQYEELSQKLKLSQPNSEISQSGMNSKSTKESQMKLEYRRPQVFRKNQSTQTE